MLDPNGDGYTSKTTAGFKANDWGNGESEIAYKAIPILVNEPIQDPLRGPGCGFTDMVDSGIGDPVMFHFDGTNFLVRFRLNKTSPNSKGYSVLIDTDQKFGFSGPNADPNAVAGNPGFEMELVLRSNHFVSLYNIDGTTTPTQIASRDYDSHAQKSIAFTENCDDPDYFYDFYLPWSDFNGLPANTKLRMVALTVMNPHPSMGNNAKSDVGGVDDKQYGDNYDKLFDDFIKNFNPTSPQDVNGGMMARTLCPTINNTVDVSSTSISGTSTEAAGTLVTVYRNGVALANKASVTSGGTWTLSVSGLVEGDVITASAKAIGKVESENNCSAVLVGQACTRPSAPALSGSNGNSNKYVTIDVPVSGVFNLYLGSQLLVANFNAVAGTQYYYCTASGMSTSKCTGGNNLDAGVYRATLTVGSCTSNSSFLCVNTSTASATPTINSPITTDTRFISGTGVANAQIILKINNAERVRLTVPASGTWSVPTSSLAITDGDKVSAYALEDGKCQSAETAQITVQKAVSLAPTITGNYCGTTTVVSGTSAEPAGTTINLYLNGGSTPIKSTTTLANGTWSISGLAIAPGSTVTAKATAAGKAESAASAAVTVRSVSSNSGITISGTTDPSTSEVYILENATSISGTASASSGTIRLYLDEVFIGSATLSGSNWTVSKASFPNDFYLYAGAKLTATYTAVNGCESAFTTPTVSIRCADPADRSVTPTSQTLCTGATPDITVKTSEAFLIYQLYNGNTPISSSVLGNGSDIILNTTTPLTTTTSNTLVNLHVVSSKIPYVKGVNCNTTLSQNVAITLNPEIENNTISMSGAGTDYCGPTRVGVITGSTPTGGSGDYTYQWQSSADNSAWNNINGATAKDYNPGEVTATTYYRRKVFSGACSNEDASASLVVTIKPAIANNLTYNGQAAFCGNGTPGQIQGSTDASFTSSQWQSSLDGTAYQNISGATAANYTPDNITQTTSYRRVVYNGSCYSYSTPITLTVDPAISNNSITAPTTTILCGSGSVGEITGSTPTGGNNSYTYKWQISTDNGASYTDIAPAVTTKDYTPGTVSATTYFRRLVSSGACTNIESNAVKITVVSAANTTINADVTELLANGTSSTTIRVQLKDAFNNNVITSGCTVTLNTDKGTISNLVNAGDGAYTATYTSGTTSGVATITGTLNGASLSKNVSITLKPTHKLSATVITATPSTLFADGVSTSTAKVAFKDYEGNPITVDAAKVKILLDGSTTTFTDQGNGEFTAIVPAKTSPTTVTVTAKYDEVATGGSATVIYEAVPVVIPTPSMAKSTVTANPVKVDADNVSTAIASVQFKDANGNNLTVEASKVEILLDNVAVSFTGKGNGLFEAIVPARTIAKVVAVTARYDGSTLDNTASVEFVPVVNPALTVVSATPATVNADGTSTSTVTVTYKDYAGNPIAVAPADAAILLDNSVVSKTANGTGVYTATVPARTAAETIAVTATYKGSTVSSTASVYFVATLNLAATTITANPTTVPANGTATSTATVTFKDYAGNNIAVDTDKLAILLNGTGTSFTSNVAGVYTAVVPARTTAESVEVTAKYDGSTVNASATVSFVSVVNLAATVVSASPATVNANGTSTATAKVEFKDYAGNPIDVTQSKVELLLGGVATSTVNKTSTGIYTAVVPARTIAENVKVEAKYDGTKTGGEANVEFVPALNLAATTLTASPGQVAADGASTSTVKVVFKDYSNNPIEVDASKVRILLDGTSVTITAGSAGTYTATVPARTTAATVQVTASYDGSATGGSTSVNFVPALNLAATTLSANPATVNADGNSTSKATLHFKDYAGNGFSVDADKVNILLDGVNAAVSSLGNGLFEATVPASTMAKTVQVTARYDGNQLNQTATVTFVPALNLAATEVSANPVSVNADGVSTSTARVVFKDYAGNPIAVDAAKVSLLLNATSVTITAGTTGEYTAIVPARTTAGTVAVTAKYDGSTVNSSASVQFVPVVNLAATVVSASPATVNADGTSTSTAKVEFKDYAGNAIAVDASKVKLLLDNVSASITAGAVGTYTATVPATTQAKTVTVTATYNETATGGNATVEFVPALNLAATTITANPTTVKADGISTSVATVAFKDYAGNPFVVDASKVSLLGNGAVLAGIQDKGNGVYETTVPARTTAESVAVTAKYDGTQTAGTATVNFVPAVNLAATTITADPATVAANGIATSTATVTFKDYAGNNIAIDPDKLAILLNNNGVTFTSNETGVYKVTVPARTIAETVEVTAMYDGTTVNASATVSFVPVVNLAATVVSASPATVNANGTSTATAKVEFKDYAGNPIDVTQSKVELLLGGVAASTVNKTSTGIYTAVVPARTIAENVKVEAKYDGTKTGGEANVEFVPALNLAATTLVASPTVVEANGTGISTVTLQFSDYDGKPINVDANKAAILLDANAVSIAAAGTGTFTATVPARTQAALVTATAKYNNTDLNLQATVEFTPVVDVAATIVSAAPAKVNADGTSTSLATVAFKDMAGNAINVDPTKVAILLNGTSVTVTAKGNGVFEATVPARTTAETVTVTAKYNGEDVNKTATVEFVPAVNFAATLVSANPEVVNADGASTSTAKVEFKDYAGNTIAVDASKVEMLLNGIAVQATAKGNGVFEAIVPARVKAEEVEASAKYDGNLADSKATVKFIPALNIAATTITANPTVVNADGSSTSTATLTFRDYDGKPINVDAAKLEVNLNGQTTTFTAGTTGVYTVGVPARTIAETVEVTGAYDAVAISAKAEVTFVPVVNLAATVVSATPATVKADGTSTSTATVTFKDYAGNTIEVDKSDVELLLSGVVATITAKGNGVFEATVPARIKAEDVEVTAKYKGTLVTSKATVTFVAALDLAATTVTANPITVNADGTSTSTATITFRDYAGNVIAVEDAKLEVMLKGTKTTFTAVSAGVYTALVPARTVAETVEVTAKYDGQTIAAKAAVEFVPALNLAATVVSAAPASVKADGISTSTAKVEFKDYAGNAIAVDPAKVAILLDGTSVSIISKGNGVFEATVPARNAAAVVVVTAKYDDTTVASKAQVEFTHVPVLSLQNSTVVANPTTVVADGISTSLITVQLKDDKGNDFVTTEPVTITSDLGTVSAVTNNGNGNYTATITSLNIGTATITAKVGSSTLEAKPVVNFVIGSANASRSIISASVNSIPANGTSTSVITVTLFDSQNRRITKGGDNVTLSTTLGTLGAVTDNNNGTYTATLTSGMVAGVATVTGRVNGALINSSAAVTFTALNRAPIARQDDFTVNNHEKLTGNVLANDSDPDGDQLSVKTSLIRQPMFGTVVMQANGSFTYTPNKGYAGTDSFTYEVCDNGSPALCAQATVNIQVVQGLVFIPEGFSPDGDGVNDTFTIYGAEKYKVSLKVFNRWGDIVYENNAYKNDWDGTAKRGLVLGDKLPDGTYFYVVDLNNGEKPRTHSLIIKRK